MNVISAICNTNERVLPTVQALSEAAEYKRKEAVMGPNDP